MPLLTLPALATDYLYTIDKRDAGRINVGTLMSDVDNELEAL